MSRQQRRFEERKKDRVRVLREKERIEYCEMLFACVEKLNTHENINLVNSGKRASVKTTIEMPLGFLEYMTRTEGIESNFTTNRWIAVNSPYNREPFLEDENTFVNKTSYLIRWLYGEGAFNGLPLSLISNPHDNILSGIKMSDCLLGKDRGHFLTVFKFLVTNSQKFEKSFWNKVIKKLNQENAESELCKDLQSFVLTGWKDNLKKAENSSDEFTLKDFLPEDVYNQIYTKLETIEIRLETVKTHKNEIIKINNDENRWSNHNRELVPFIDQLIFRNEWGYNQMEVDKLCSESQVLLGKEILLSSRKKSKYSGFQAEPLMLLVSSLNKPFTVVTGFNIYEFLAKPEKNCYVDNLANLNVDNVTMKKWLGRINSSAKYLDTEKGTNIWVKLHDSISNQITQWEAVNKGKSNSNFEKMKASSLDTGLLYLRIAHHINETLGDGRDNNGAFELTLVEFLNYIINMIEKDTIRYESMLDKKAHWGTRMNNFFIPVIKEFIQHKKDNTGKKTGRAKLVDTKKIEARKLLTTKLGTEFPILDRIRKNPDGCDKIFQWEIRDFNTTTGEGGQLCHYVSSNNNGILSEENTFWGPAGDNVMMGDNDCEKIHLTVDGEFYKAFIKDNPTPPTDELEMEAWLNNKKYAAVHSHLIVEEIRKNLVSA